MATSSHAPAVRARWPQHIVAWWEAHAPHELDLAAQRLAPRILAAIRAAGETEWIDLGLHLDFIEALREICGREAFARKYVEAADHALTLPAFEAVIRPLVRVIGRRALAQGFPRGWGMFMRSCGYVDVHQREVAVGSEVRFTSVPMVLAKHEVYAESLACMLEAVMRRAGFPGRVELDKSGADRGELSYRLIETQR